VTSLPRVQTPLGAGAELAEATNGDVGAFGRFAAPLVVQGAPFVSVSLWRLGEADPHPLIVVGQPALLAASSPQAIRDALARAVATPQLSVVNLIDASQPRLGYAYTSKPGPAVYAAYGEAALPADRTAVVQQRSAFDGLDYALYLGPTETPSTLLIASVRDLPISGRRSFASVDFGDTKLTLVMTPRGQLGGSVLAALPWVIAIVGAAFTLLAVFVTERLIRGRHRAEQLARANRGLFESQRNIAQSLQRSLLPSRLPDIEGLEVAARYEPGVEGVDIGGDWYEVIALDDDRVLVVVGDVSGRGLEASAAMASLRFATRGYALEGHGPAEILAPSPARRYRPRRALRDDFDHAHQCGPTDADHRKCRSSESGDPRLEWNSHRRYGSGRADRGRQRDALLIGDVARRGRRHPHRIHRRLVRAARRGHRHRDGACTTSRGTRWSFARRATLAVDERRCDSHRRRHRDRGCSMADVDGDLARFEHASDETGEALLRVSGELDLSNATLLRDALDTSLAADPPRLVLEVGDLTFMDSSGLAVLLQAARRVDLVILRNPRDVIRRLVDTTGVASVLKMEP
jgi:anti-anti-sigma factor